MTPYLIIFFHLLFPGNIIELMKERIIDTAIGSGIAFFASLFLVPAWEKNSIKSYMTEMLSANEKYYEAIVQQFLHHSKGNTLQSKISRREVLIVLANLSDAFTRMLSEPKRHRRGAKNVHRFVVINHTLISHLSTLSYLLQNSNIQFETEDFIPLIHNTKLYIKNARYELTMQQDEIVDPDLSSLKVLHEKVSELVEKRKVEIINGQLETPTKKVLVETKSVADQFNYIFSDAAVIYKICTEHNTEMSQAK
jgi:hypothetical protein